MHRLPLLAALALLAPLAAHAADLPVRYTVDEKQLKNAISGTNLTFQLYSDAACTTLADSTVVTIDNVGIRERIKQFKPKSGVAQLKVVELHQTFLGVVATGNLFLKVTGTGVVPVGGACQAQAAAVAGGGGGSGAVVKDGLGTVMGPSLNGQSFLVTVGPDLIQLNVRPSGYVYGTQVFYAGPSCTGLAYSYVLGADLFKIGSPIDATQYFVYGTSGATTPYASFLDVSTGFNNQVDCDNGYGPGNVTFVPPYGCCVFGAAGINFMAPVSFQTLPTFTPPFTLDVP